MLRLQVRNCRRPDVRSVYIEGERGEMAIASALEKGGSIALAYENLYNGD
jgi:hypothetical protein